MVAPINLLAREGNTSASHSPTVGPLSELSRSLHEETKMAPSLHTEGGNSSYMQRLVKGDFRRVFHAAVGKRLVFFHVKVGTDILFF